MGNRGGTCNLLRRTEGSVAVISACLMLVIAALASLALDMGHLYTTRNELQNSADAAALAAAGNLIHDYGSGVVRDATAAQQSAMTVAQRQSQLNGLPTVDDSDRNDLTLVFGVWDINAGNPATAWTEIGSTCGSDSTANAVKVTLRRASDTVYGPVSNFLAGAIGFNTSQVSATATAYLGYTTETLPGTVEVPLALPKNSVTASTGRSGWFASLFGPSEAVASTTKTYVFKDTGGANVTTSVPTSPVAALDPSQAYLFTVGVSDAVPDTIKDILTKVYNPSYTSSNPVAVGDLKLGQQIYPRSEYPWGKSYIGAIFQKMQQAYNAKKDASGKWRVTLPIYDTTPSPLTSRPWPTRFLARLLAPFWPSEAYACSTMPPPAAYIQGFVNADITSVTYNNSSCDDCSYTFPKTISGKKYNNKKDCLKNYSNSSWNKNTVTIENVSDSDTAPPTDRGGSLSGLNPTGSGGKAFASIPRLVK